MNERLVGAVGVHGVLEVPAERIDEREKLCHRGY